MFFMYGKTNVYITLIVIIMYNAFVIICFSLCEKAWRFPVALCPDPCEALLTPDTPDKSIFVSESCMCSEKVSGGECEIRFSFFFFFHCVFHFLALQMYGSH